jgi:hydrogenase maturation protease
MIPAGPTSVLQAARKTLVIGYGSPIRGDDAIGPLAADLLEAEGLPSEVTVISRHILTADLVPDIVANDLVLFLDATADGEAGEVRFRSLAPDAAAPSSMAHFLDPRELLAWADALYGQVPEAYLVSVAGASFDYAGYQLSAAAEAALRPMLERVRALIAAPLADPGRGIPAADLTSGKENGL